MHHAKSLADFDKLHANESAFKYKQSLCGPADCEQLL
jgi:hypothetical protein